MNMVFEKVPAQASYEPGIDKNMIIDQNYIQSIKNKIKDNNDKFLDFLKEDREKSDQQLKHLKEETEILQKIIKDIFDPITKLYGKVIKTDIAEEIYDTDENSIAGTHIHETFEEISSNSRLYEQDKKKLINQFRLELTKIDKNVSLDTSIYGQSVTSRLEQRNQQRKIIERNKNEIEIEKQLLIKNQQQEIWTLNKQFEDEEALLWNTYENEIIKHSKEYFGENANKYEIIYKESIKKDKSQRHQFFQQFKVAMKGLENGLSINQLKIYREKLKNIVTNRHQQEEIRKNRENKDFAELKTKHEEEIREYKQKKAEFLINDIAYRVLSSIKHLNPEKETEDYKRIQKENYMQTEKEFNENQLVDISKLHKQSEAYEKKMLQQKLSLEKQKKQLLEKINSIHNEEKENLIADIKKIDESLKDVIEKQSFDLEKRIQIRKDLTKEKLQQILEENEIKAKIAEKDIELKIIAEKETIFNQSLEENLKTLPKEHYEVCMKKILTEKHELEFISLQKRLKNKLKESLLTITHKLMQQKIGELENIRFKYRDKFKNSNRSSETQLAIQKEEIEAIKRLDYEYMKKIESVQDNQWKEIHKLNKDELLNILNEQMIEMKKFLGNNHEIIQKKEEKILRDKEIIENEARIKIELLEQQKAELEKNKLQKQQELEEMIKKEKAYAETIKAKQDMIEKRRNLISRQKKEREKLLNTGDITAAQMEKLIKEHQIELQAIEYAISKERDRQMANMSHKLAEKRSRKLEYDKIIQQLKEDQEKWEEEIDKLSVINNIQAKTLLIKWRKNPKKGLKHITKSIMKNEFISKTVPIVAEQPKPAKRVLNDKRFEEIIKGIEQIEEKMNIISSGKMNRVMKSLSTLMKKANIIN